MDMLGKLNAVIDLMDVAAVGNRLAMQGVVSGLGALMPPRSASVFGAVAMNGKHLVLDEQQVLGS